MLRSSAGPGFLSTLSLRRATRGQNPGPRKDTDFYPRSPCGERLVDLGQNCGNVRISIHALLAESDVLWPYLFRRSPIFLSTLSLRRATKAKTALYRSMSDFYPRSPCGERLMYALKFANSVLFLSTLSLRRATVLVWCSCGGVSDFYPRSPCGERPKHS